MPRHTMVLGIRHRERNTAVSDVGFCEKAFPDVCMKAGRMGNTFGDGAGIADGRRITCFGIAQKNQECEFPCRSDAVIFIMRI